MIATAAQVGYEDCLRVTGVGAQAPERQRRRSGPARSKSSRTKIEVLNKAEPLPFHAHENPGEDIRLKYRYLDLRTPDMQHKMRTRIKLVQALRRWLDARGFQDIETPILTKATPEGARDFLVPARMHPGEFYALPQSPQLFKQILMVAGFDRYYQIARCFRDEALRADRQLEFTQLDMEFAWVSERDVQDTTEALIRDVFREVMDVELADPFPRMTYAEAMRRYGSDKPDLRIALEFTDIAELVKGCEFKVFTDWANHADGRVVALRVPGGATLSRKQIDDYAAHCRQVRRQGPGVDEGRGRGQGPRGHQFADREVPRRRHARRDLLTRPARSPATCVFFGAATYKTASDFMGALRLKLGKDLGLVADGWAPLWVTDFPMFEWDEEAQALRRAASSVHRAGGRRCRRPARECEDRGVARLRHGAQRQRDRRRFDPHPSLVDADRRCSNCSASARKRRKASSASCSTRCATARRRTAASPSASTASPR